MHERAPVGSAALDLLQRLDGAPAAVTVAIAPDVVEDIAKDAWESTTRGTPLERTRVTWIVRHPLLACFLCGTEYEGGRLDRCPACGGDGLVVEDVALAEVISWEP